MCVFLLDFHFGQSVGSGFYRSVGFFCFQIPAFFRPKQRALIFLPLSFFGSSAGSWVAPFSRCSRTPSCAPSCLSRVRPTRCIGGTIDFRASKDSHSQACPPNNHCVHSTPGFLSHPRVPPLLSAHPQGPQTEAIKQPLVDYSPQRHINPAD